MTLTNRVNAASFERVDMGKGWRVRAHHVTDSEVFAQLLPSLLDQWLGGGWTTGNMVGFFAREAGASGLVYPSARSNAAVEIEDGVVTMSSGWCFVRYAGAPPMEITHQASLASDAWPQTAGWGPDTYSWVKEFIPVKGVSIAYQRDGARAGSFAVTGLQEYNWAVYRLAQIKGVLKAIDSELGASVCGRLHYLSLYSPAEDIAGLAGVVMPLKDYSQVVLTNVRDTRGYS